MNQMAGTGSGRATGSNGDAGRGKVMLAYIAARNVNKFDALLPLLVHLQASRDSARCIVYTILLFEHTHEDLQRSGFHMDAVREMSRYCRPFAGVMLPGRMRALLKLGALLWLLLRHRLTGHRVVVLLPWDPKAWHERAVFGLLSRFASVFQFPGLQTPATSDLMKRFEHWNRLQDIGVKRAGKTDFRPKYPPICYLDSEKLYQTRPGLADPVAIGVPRLYESWLPFVRAFGAKHLAIDLATAGLDPALPAYGVVVLTNPRYHWFPNGDADYPAMLSEIIAASRRHFPGMPVLLKPKANMRRLFEELLDREGLLGDGVHLVDTGLAALASRAVWAATINESSGVFDFLCADVPAIEYARYAPHWLEITPSGSAWRSFPGLRYVETVQDLETAMATIARGGAGDGIRDRLADFFGHRENLSFLYS